jgi:hypothetical protein
MAAGEELKMTFDEWLQIGLDNAWVGPSVCSTHDGIPMTGEEEEEMYEGDPCVHVLRLYEDAETKKAVEENHSPSVWRATNSGFSV